MLQPLSDRELLIIGGPNGSGNTTIARDNLHENGYKYLRADDIAYELIMEIPYRLG